LTLTKRDIAKKLGINTNTVGPIIEYGVKWLTKWVKEIEESLPAVYFRLAQPKARPNYPNVDEAGNPIYQVAQISAKPIKPKL
jgi:hypothetical protein